jgi:hypothetical protein
MEKNLRFLPREMPRDPYHARILDAVESGRLLYSHLPGQFYSPGIGFHNTLYRLTLHLLGYRKWGRQTFVVSEGLQDALARTSLEAVGAWDIKVPYPDLYVALPNSGKYVWGGERTRWHECGGVFVSFDEESRTLMWDASTSEFRPIGDPKRAHPGYINLYVWGMENERSQGEGDDASLYLTIDLQQMLDEGWDLEECITAIMEDDAEEIPTYAESIVTPLGREIDVYTPVPENPAQRKRMTRETLEILRIVFNALLYIGSDNAEVEESENTKDADARRAQYLQSLGRATSPSKKKRWQRKLDALPKDRVIWVGRSVQTEEEEASTSESEQRPGRRAWVRGHWWPRKDTIRKRLQASQKAVGVLGKRLMDRRGQLKDTFDPGEQARTVMDILTIEDQLQEAEVNHEAMESDLLRKLRWVRPYLRNRDAAGSVESHSYRLKGGGSTPPASG